MASSAAPNRSAPDRPDSASSAVAAPDRPELEALLEAVHAAWVGCSGDPSACEPRSDLGHVYGGPLLDVVVVEVADWSDRGWAVRPARNAEHDRLELLSMRPTPIDQLRPLNESRSADESGWLDDGALYEVRFCDIDGRILVQADAAPDGGDIVLDESVASMIRVATVQRYPDGRLRLVARWTEQRFEGGGGCAR